MKKLTSFKIKVYPSKYSCYCTKVILYNQIKEFFPDRSKSAVLNWATQYYTTMGLTERFSEYLFIST